MSTDLHVLLNLSKIYILLQNYETILIVNERFSKLYFIKALFGLVFISCLCSLHYNVYEKILKNARLLRGTRYSVDRDYPAEITNARKLLWPRFKELRQNKRFALRYVILRS